jgi:hypothetical protein
MCSYETAAFVMNQALPIYLLSLARAAERRASISAHLQALGLEYELVDGVDGRALPAEEHAPGRSRFTAILAPRGAGVAMTSLHSMISPRRKQRGARLRVATAPGVVPDAARHFAPVPCQGDAPASPPAARGAPCHRAALAAAATGARVVLQSAIRRVP